MSKNKSILVTGGSRGIGKAILYNLSKNYNVISINRKYSPEIEEFSDQIIFDLNECLNDVEVLKNKIAKIKDLYALINNAALLTSFPLIGMPNKNIFEQINVNLMSAIIVSKISLPVLIKNKSSRIINIGSMATRVKSPGDTVYAASKAGLENFTEVLSRETYKKGVTVNMLSISATPTGMLSQILGDDKNKVLRHVPNNRFAEEDDIMNVVEFYLSERSKDISGQNIFLGGI